MSTEPVRHIENNIAKRERLTIEGTVQGVGFRPFVYRLAQDLGLAGYVQNTSAGAVIEIEGAPNPLKAFKKALNTDADLKKAHVLATISRKYF